MKTLDEIKHLTTAGETAQVDVALEELLAVEPKKVVCSMCAGVRLAGEA